MNYKLITIILTIGASGIIAQVLLLRELLVSFYGNELIFGIILSNWVIIEALGAFCIGKIIDRLKNKFSPLIIFQILFAVSLQFSVYFSRTFKSFLGIPFGEGIGLPLIFWASFFTVLPVSFCHGALFICGCKIYQLVAQEPAASISKAYALETTGTIIGGLLFTYFLIPNLNSFQITFILLAINLFACLVFLKSVQNYLKYAVISLIFIFGYLFFIGGVEKTQALSLAKEWQGREVLESRNSLLGNITVTKIGNQQSFFYNGIPIITAPFPDLTFVQEYGNLPFLFHPNPKNILIIGGGSGGLIDQILKEPVIRIDYLELDPILIEMLKKYSSALTRDEFSDPRLNLKNIDGKEFLRCSKDNYDVIIIGLSKPQDLSSNRFFTQEFFLLAKERLKEGGILSLYLPGSLTHLSKELKDLNACIQNALKNTFPHLMVIPGEYNIFLASKAGQIQETDAELIFQRIIQRKIQNTILTKTYLDYRLSKETANWFRSQMEGSTKIINQDTQPFALFEVLSIWNRQFSKILSNYFDRISSLNLTKILKIILGIFVILMLIIKFKPALAKSSIFYGIATTGFFGMLSSLILLFSFQVNFGVMYYKMALFFSLQMGGIAFGSIVLTKKIETIRKPIKIFIKIEAAIIIFSCLLAWQAQRLNTAAHLSTFILLFFISGVLLGMEFPLANKIYLAQKKQLGQTAGALYFCDLFGGWIAGIFGSVIFLPILGIFNTCILMVILKLSSLLLVALNKKLLESF